MERDPIESRRVSVAQDQASNVSGSNELYPLLPSLNDLLLSPEFESLLLSFPRNAIVRSGRATLEELRDEISIGVHTRESLMEELERLPGRVASVLSRESRFSLRAVIN